MPVIRISNHGATNLASFVNFQEELRNIAADDIASVSVHVQDALRFHRDGKPSDGDIEDIYAHIVAIMPPLKALRFTIETKGE